MPRALVLCAKYSQVAADRTLTDELVGELERRGYEVTVAAVGDITFSALEEPRDRGRTECLFRAMGGSKFAKYVWVWPRATICLARHLRRAERHDLLIAFAPLSVILPLVLMSTWRSPGKTVAIVFDLFPIHQVQIGRIHRRWGRLFRRIESGLLKRFHLVTGMTPRNVECIRTYYRIGAKRPLVRTLPLWGVRSTPPVAARGKDDGSIRIVFGGQIIPGRSIEALIEMVRKLRERGVPLTLTIFSDGERWRALKEENANDPAAFVFKERLSRDAYLREIASCDVGAIVTDSRVSMPTFPSKIIDYMNAGLRCFCIIEKESDIEEVVGDPDFLHVNRFEFDEAALLRAVRFLGRCREKYMPDGAKRFSRFSVASAVDALLSRGAEN